MLGNCLATAVVARWEGVRIPSGDDVPVAEMAAANQKP
jgi:hypothetical protein